MSGRRNELARWGEYALEQARGPVLTGLRRKLAAWRDPRARLIRQRRRARRGSVAGAATTGVLGGGAYASYAADDLFGVDPGFTETMLDVASFGLGGAAVAAGVGAVGAGLRYRRLKRTPLPDPPPEPVELPAPGSRAREPMQRLRDAEKSLHESLTQLSASGHGVGAASATEARATAAQAASALRSVAARLVAVEGAIPHAPEEQREVLRSDVGRLRAELDDGVEGYGSLVAAAGRAVAASGATEQKHLMQDATDRLSGLASALQELSEPRARGAGDPFVTESDAHPNGPPAEPELSAGAEPSPELPDQQPEADQAPPAVDPPRPAGPQDATRRQHRGHTEHA